MTDNSANGDAPSVNCARGSVNTYKPKRIPARILWPALGFPAVISPADASKSDDASTCVVVVILSTRPKITQRQAADHLRFVPWEQRHTRYLPYGTANGFTEDELEVITSGNDSKYPFGIVNVSGANRDEFTLLLYFGFDANYKNGFSAALSSYVMGKYSEWGYSYLHEIRATRAASSRLTQGQYNLFWVNKESTDTPDRPSDEMAVLLKEYATPRRQQLSTTLPLSFLVDEYRYEFGAFHDPYSEGKSSQRFTEVLHPLFVTPAVPHLQIGHLTDLHVSVRNDVYDENLQIAQEKGLVQWDVNGKSTKITDVDFNNWNKAVRSLYDSAKQGNCDVLLLTGDLIDYGRGHVGIPSNDMLGDDAMYHVDRNWFLFYYLLAGGGSYTKPAYTTLGNHDWRINPYTPFAIAGAPDAKSLINNYMQYKPNSHKEQETEDEWKDAEEKDNKGLNERLNHILLKAHGPGAEKAFSYLMEAHDTLGFVLERPGEFADTLWNLLQHTPTMNIAHAPTETTVESVAWYLLLINPFLDYAFHLPGGYELLMLDWGEYETLLFPIAINGKEWAYNPWEAAAAAAPGPKARAVLTGVQKRMVDDFAAKPSAAKVLGIHMPPVGPYPAWVDDVLYAGRMEHPKGQPAPHYRTNYPDGTSQDWDAFFAILPKDAAYGLAADYGSFEQDREWFLNAVRKDEAHVRLVLSGHIHRNGLFIVRDGQGEALAGTMLIQMVPPASIMGVAAPAVTRQRGGEHGPLYVNTTSAGPRGHSYTFFQHKPGLRDEEYVDSGYSVIVLSQDGTIQKVEFRTAKTGATQPAPASAPVAT